MQILVTNNKMKFAKENLNLEKGLNKEWVITNGLGGFASSTIIGANTRRYHGLLIAPLMPPARRTLILSKLDESIEINGNKTGECDPYRLCGGHAEILYRLCHECYYLQSSAGCA